jgi:hypothetical protein
MDPSHAAWAGAQERILEHHPVEKRFVVETRPLGEHEIAEEVKVRQGMVTADRECMCCVQAQFMVLATAELNVHGSCDNSLQLHVSCMHLHAPCCLQVTLSLRV